jgi:hypothetical protein
MKIRSFRSVFPALCATLFAVFLCAMLVSPPCRAGETGMLKLKVRPCASNNWLVGAAVEVSIQRSGAGEVDSAKGTTDGAGYVEFTFTSLEGDDEAHVTVTPNGASSDPNHVYYWIASRGRTGGLFDLAPGSDSFCDDAWYDFPNQILLCKYQ